MSRLITFDIWFRALPYRGQVVLVLHAGIVSLLLWSAASSMLSTVESHRLLFAIATR